MPQEPFNISEKILMRLRVTSVPISYYEWTSIPLTSGNIKWDTCIKKFSVQWKAIQDLKNNDDATLPKFSNRASIIKLFEAY